MSSMLCEYFRTIWGPECYQMRYNSWVIPIPYVSPVTYMFERIQYVDPKSIICIAISLAEFGAVIALRFV